MSSAPTNTMQTALACWANNIATLPIAPGIDKRPALAWKQYQATPPELDEVQAWFADHDGIGIITGTVSGNLVMLELEGRVTAEQRAELDDIAEGTIPELWTRLQLTWTDKSPSGGIHYYLRLTLAEGEAMPRNTKIARAADKHILAETRGEAGYAVIAPTPGAYHQTGNAWTLASGHPSHVETFTLDELDTIVAVIHSVLDETPIEPTPVEVNPLWRDQPRETIDGDIKPGDDYEAKTDWADILTPAGWTLAFTRGHTRYWTRPGKTAGISATTGNAQDRDRLYVFTSSTEFEPEQPYTKFGAYALLNHGGDHSEAARELAQKGYGHRAERHLKPVENMPANIPPDRDASVTPITAAAGNAVPKPAVISSDPDALTDHGNAILARDRWQHRLTYIPGMKRWAEWDGTRWTIQPDDAPATQAVIETIYAIPVDNDQLISHRKKSLSATAINNAAKLLRSEADMRTPAEKFDQNAYELNTPGGIVDLRTGGLTPPRADHWHAKQTTVTPGDTESPAWSTFLAWAMQDDTERILYLQQLAGISLIGETREHVLPLMYGAGANGKSVFLETVSAVLGDYANEAPNNLLTAGPDRHPTELTVLQGRRFIAMSELNQRAKVDEAKLKSLTGGDTITARVMHGDFYTFTPTHTIWLATNHKPRVEVGGDSFWRRVRLIPWQNKVTDADRNENLKNELLEQGAGILRWAINGAIHYLEHGLITPSIVKAATDEYATEEDSFKRFADERLIFSTAARTPTADLFQAYRSWCRENGESELDDVEVGRELKQRYGVIKKPSNNKKFYIGIMLATSNEEDDAAPHWTDK